jgi:hypothetical protein
MFKRFMSLSPLNKLMLIFVLSLVSFHMAGTFWMLKELLKKEKIQAEVLNKQYEILEELRKCND